MFLTTLFATLRKEIQTNEQRRNKPLLTGSIGDMCWSTALTTTSENSLQIALENKTRKKKEMKKSVLNWGEWGHLKHFIFKTL